MFGKKDTPQIDLEIFTVFDSKVGNFRAPLMAENRFEMIRNVEMFCRNPQNHQDPLFVNAEDFQVFKIGGYSKKTGELYSQNPEHVANVFEIKSVVMRSLKDQVGVAST